MCYFLCQCCPVKDNASQSNDAPGSPVIALQVSSQRSHRSATYQKVRDERKRAIRGLWVSNGRY